jgi:arabinose-5-phosphate isomerase
LVLDIARRVLTIESDAIRSLVDRLDDGFVAAVDLVLGCRGRVVVTGMGKSGIVGQKLSATLASTGTPSHFLNPSEAVHGDLGRLVRDDLVVALSNTGETEEIVRLLELIRRIGARLIGMSGNPRSTLARHADVHVHVGVDAEACPLDLVPTASTTAFLAMGDALAVACYERRGFTAKDFARFHPGGRLGRRLVQVRELMHQGEGLPAVPESADLRSAVEVMNSGRLGVVCMTDADGKLVGILTDGDLRRRSLDRERPLEGSAGDAMTRDAATVGPESLAAEALAVLEERKITSLPVVDPDRRLVGLIQIHDLWRTELF